FWNKSFGNIGMKFFYDSGIDFLTAKRHQYPHPDLDYRNEFLWYRIRKGSFQVERQNDLGKIQNRAAINRTYKSSKINAEHNPGINRSQLRCLIARGIMVMPRVTAAIFRSYVTINYPIANLSHKLLDSVFPAFDFFINQHQFTAGLPGNRSVFLCSYGKIRHHIFHRTVRKIFGSVVFYFTKIIRNIIAHSVQLAEINIRMIVR